MDVKLQGDRDKLFKLWDNVSSAVQLILTDVALLIQNSAKINAPYLTWNLRRSISTQFNFIQKWTVIVWSPVKYARRREYENYKNPQTLRYLRRWYSENENEIKDIINKNLSKELN